MSNQNKGFYRPGLLSSFCIVYVILSVGLVQLLCSYYKIRPNISSVRIDTAAVDTTVIDTSFVDYEQNEIYNDAYDEYSSYDYDNEESYTEDYDVTESYENTTVTEEPRGQINDNQIYDTPDQMPSFPGGQGALMQYLSSHVKYPAVAEENGIQGRVTVQFVVEKDGSVTDVKTMKSVDPSLDKEAERVVRSMPKWQPGRNNGQTVRVKYFVPVVFRLQ